MLELWLQWLFDTHHVLRASLLEYICHVFTLSSQFVTVSPYTPRSLGTLLLLHCEICIHIQYISKLKILSSTSRRLSISHSVVTLHPNLASRIQHANAARVSDICTPQLTPVPPNTLDASAHASSPSTNSIEPNPHVIE